MNNATNGLQKALKAERQKRQKAEREAWIRKAYANFTKNYETVESAILSSTQASWAGSGGGYSLELFPDGSFEVIWSNEIGNLYDAPGIIVGIPTLGDDEYDGENEMHCFDNAIEALGDVIEQAIADC
jgi:hypothetical protein